MAERPGYHVAPDEEPTRLSEGAAAAGEVAAEEEETRLSAVAYPAGISPPKPPPVEPAAPVLPQPAPPVTPGRRPLPPGALRFTLEYVGTNPAVPPGHTIPVTLAGQPFLIGRVDRKQRGEPSDFEFAPLIQNISRKHAAFDLREGDLAVCDLRSVNGTFVNGVKLEPNQYYYIKDGDVLSFSSKGIDYRVHMPALGGMEQP